MAVEIQCQWLTPAGKYKRQLRRSTYRYPEPEEKECDIHGFHDARVTLDLVPEDADFAPIDYHDSRWPTVCDCGYKFVDGDSRVASSSPLYYVGDDRQTLLTLAEAPVGAMWDANWMRDVHPTSGPASYRGPDGLTLCVRTPGGDWCVDGPSNNGNGWTREGEVPFVTARPSILVGSYHGWLTNGRLIEC